MNEDQERHLNDLVLGATARIKYKYSKGAAEHGGNLWDLSAPQLLEEAINEAADELVYLLTLRDKLKNYHPKDSEDYYER